MENLLTSLLGGVLLTIANLAAASSLESEVIELDCPNLITGTLHLNEDWDDGYLAVKGFGILKMTSYEQIDKEGAILTFRNGNIRAKILPLVKNNVIDFYLWDQGGWRLCSWK